MHQISVHWSCKCRF